MLHIFNVKDSYRIPRNVVLLGLVSFFNDIAAEMIYPIVPIFLTSVLGASMAAVGMIEGIAEATASLSKFIFGYISDYLQKRKPFVVGGYILGTLSKMLMGLAFAWPLVLFARIIDRLGKGLRTAARDSLLLDNATPTNKGFIFGFHRTFDSLGAVLGPLVALVLIALLNDNLRLIFFLAFIPSLVGVILLIIFVKETKRTDEKTPPRQLIKLSWSGISPRLKMFLLVSFLFAAGNSSDVFLLLNAKQLGFTTTLVVLVYVLYNISQTVFATPAGGIADRIGARKVYAGGLAVFAVVYFLFGLVRNPIWLWILFPIYGVYIAATDGVSKSYIAEFISHEESGTFFGLHQTLTAVAGFLASFIGGLLWVKLGATATFWYGSLMATAALGLLILFRRHIYAR